MIAYLFVFIFSPNAWSIDIRKAPSTCEIDINTPVSIEEKRARVIWESLTGSPIPYCDDRLKRMALYLKSDRPRDAAKVATSDADFYNIRVRGMASQMCTFENTKRASVNDCVATIVGAVRDGLDYRKILTGNFWYKIDEEKVPAGSVQNNIINDIIRTNDHFDEIDLDGLSMFHVLKKVDGQIIPDPLNLNRTIPARDSAGVITSRAFMAAHAVAGTNRRLVEKSLEVFLCSPIRTWADNLLPDKYVGRDVTRTPGGDPNKYLVSCSGCHAPMDSMRGVFAYVDFINGRYIYDDRSVVDKMNRASDTTPDLTFYVAGDSYDNLAKSGANASRFGWRESLKGNSIHDFATMIATSEQFSRCTAEHVFRATCGRQPEEEIKLLIDTFAKDFDKGSEKDIRVLFERFVLRPECTGE
jgi:hypothetical protein